MTHRGSSAESQRADIDLRARLLYVRQTVKKDGTVRECGKTNGSLRTVPLTKQAVDAIKAHPVRMDSLFLFPARTALEGFMARDVDADATFGH
jgi:integrase